jgi:hypothetical protein
MATDDWPKTWHTNVTATNVPPRLLVGFPIQS